MTLSFKDGKTTCWATRHRAVVKLVGMVGARCRASQRGRLSTLEQREFKAIATRTSDDLAVWNAPVGNGTSARPLYAARNESLGGREETCWNTPPKEQLTPPRRLSVDSIVN